MIVVLGGSSPWTLELLSRLEDYHVHLVGRDADALHALSRFARPRTSAHLSIGTDPIKALRQAELVLCQVRVGGWEGRLADVSGATRWGAWGDETLGLGGLRSGLRSAPAMVEWARAAAGVPALMFSNPTDLLARLWAANSGATCLSICEMPTLLLREQPSGSRYLGINHVGYAIGPDGRRQPSKWLAMLPDLQAEVRAQRASPPTRPRFVADLSRRVRVAIAGNDAASVQELLALRPARWYELLIVPLIDYFMRGRRFHGVVGRPNRGQLPLVAPDVLVESLGTALEADPFVNEQLVAGEISEYAAARNDAYACLIDCNEASFRRFLRTDSFSAGATYSADLLSWVTSQTG